MTEPDPEHVYELVHIPEPEHVPDPENGLEAEPDNEHDNVAAAPKSAHSISSYAAPAPALPADDVCLGPEPVDAELDAAAHSPVPAAAHPEAQSHDVHKNSDTLRFPPLHACGPAGPLMQPCSPEGFLVACGTLSHCTQLDRNQALVRGVPSCNASGSVPTVPGSVP